MRRECKACLVSDRGQCQRHFAGARLREARKRKGWSQRDLANAAGISGGEVSHIETGKRSGSAPKRLAATALGVSIDWLLGREG